MRLSSFVIISLAIGLGVTAAEARRRYDHSRNSIARVRVAPSPAPVPELVQETPFGEGSGPVMFVLTSDLEDYRPPVKPRIVYNIVEVHKADDQRIWGTAFIATGSASIVGGMLGMVMTGMRRRKDRIVLLRIHPGSSERANSVRLWWKRTIMFELTQRLCYTIRTIRNRQKLDSVQRDVCNGIAIHEI